ncbi:MAG: cupin domain-containing protein [Terriglobales bacterium]
MKRTFSLGLAIVGLLCFAGQFLHVKAQHSQTHPKNTFHADAIAWGAAPPFLQPGAQFALLEGDPGAKDGEYTIRLKMPDGYKIAPHWHPLRENVTVISGTFKLGMGDSFNDSKMATFHAGDFGYLDPSMHHYAMASGETIVQVHGKSPFQINYINRQDDPRVKP